jgi:hypothetical protein
MFLESPHLRFEGLYVSRNTYIRQGVSEWKREKTCHLVTYFRYFRCAAKHPECDVRPILFSCLLLIA